MRRILSLICAAAGLWASAAAAAPAHDYRLDNGLRVIVREDHRAPVVVSQLWYRVGSNDEVNGATGVAHALEHMMFKGTAKVPAGAFSRQVAQAGGTENAFTNTDETVYFEQVHRAQLDRVLALEADRMQHLAVSPAEFAKEIQVVMEERRWRTDDKPQARVHEQLMAAAFTAAPNRRPVIGWMNDLEHLTGGDVRAWYRRYYAPNNAVLVIAGDVSPAQALALAKKRFGGVPARRLPAFRPQVEPPQPGIRRLAVKAPARLPYLEMGWHAPVLTGENQWEPYALEVLAAVLDGNAASRLNRLLVRQQQVALSVGAGYDSLGRLPGLFVVDGTPAEGKTVGDLEARVRAVLDDLKANGVTPDELAQVKAQVIAGQVYQRDSVFYQAMQLGQLATLGLPLRLADDWAAHIEAVTPEQVRAVARQYLTDDALTVATLDPQPLDGRRINEGAGHGPLR